MRAEVEAEMGADEERTDTRCVHVRAEIWAEVRADVEANVRVEVKEEEYRNDTQRQGGS